MPRPNIVLYCLNYCNLHVVVSVECFVADSARELRWANKDLSWRRNPVLGWKRSCSIMSRDARVVGS